MRSFWTSRRSIRGIFRADRAEYGFESRRFSFHWEYGLAFDGACMVSVDLPGYEVARIATGQLTDRPEQAGEEKAWEVVFVPSETDNGTAIGGRLP